MTHEADREVEAHVIGTAQDPATWPWTPNPDGRRTVAEAIALARHWGVAIPDDIRCVFREDMLPKPRKRDRETIDAREINRLIMAGVRGNLHDRAWDVADNLVRAMREGARR